MAERDAGARAVVPLNPYQVNATVTYSQRPGDGSGWFGPLQPPAPVAPPEVAGRRFDFPAGYNLNLTPRSYEAIGFVQLRALADNYDLLRLVIETRKDQVEALGWHIAPKEDAYGGTNGREANKAVLAKAKELTAFFRKPDRANGWAPWLRSLLEDLFVIDAPTLYKRRTRGGALFALDVVDGATIKPVIDDWGRVPLPPAPAYQQVLKGLPAVSLTTADLFYRPRNVRSNKVYGCSPVEQIVMTVNIALRRQVSQLSYYTEGNIPEALIGVPESWTPDQIAAFQSYWDTLLEGNAAQRRHAKFVPGGVAKTFIPTKEPELKNIFDEWLARVVCFAFSISSQPFVAQVNRATAETAQETATDEGLAPIKAWVKSGIDDILVDEFRIDDLEFAWTERKKADPEKEAIIVTKYVGGALLTINEGRARIGLEPSPDPIADKLGAITGSGFVPIEISAEPPADPMEFGLPATPGGAQQQDGQPPAPGQKPKLDGQKPGEQQQDDGEDGEVGKAADAPFGKRAARVRRLDPIRSDRPFARRVEAGLRAGLTRALAKAGKTIGAEVRTKLREAGIEKLAKDKKSDDLDALLAALAAQIADQIDLSSLDTLVDVTAEALERLTLDTAQRALAQLGVTDRADLVDQVNTMAVDAANARAAELVGKQWRDGELVDNPNAKWAITDSTRDMLRSTITGGLADNVGYDEIVDRIEALGFGTARAETIARTEIARANSAAALDSYRAARDGAGVKTKKEWLVDDEPCEVCQENAAAGAIDLDDDFPSGDAAPPGHPRCLPGETRITAEGVTAATKRWYDGNLVVIRTASGKQLRCTPNHPVLTPAGWVAAGMLNEGSDVIACLGAERMAFGIDHQNDNVPSRIQDVAEAFGRSEQVAAVPVPLSPEDFHGDGIGSEVAIIWTDRLLVHRGNASNVQFSSKNDFGRADVKGALLDGQRMIDLGLHPDRLPLGGAVGRADLGAALLGRHVGPAQASRSAVPADLDVGAAQPPFDRPAADSEHLRKLLNSFAGRVAADQIVHVDIEAFHGWVYNLQTDSGAYLAEGIVTHNCECALSPVVEEEAAEDAAPDEQGGEAGDTVDIMEVEAPRSRPSPRGLRPSKRTT
jgi:hypothetical protein